MKKFIIAPSILSADFACLGEDINRVLAAGADWIHVDVMDNHYVPNLTFGPLVCKALRHHGIKAPLDVHLMVKPVDRLIEMFAKAGANYISFHPDASDDVDRSIQLIHQLGCKAGIVLNPETTIDCLENLMDKIDLILVMSVQPGFGGQQFIPGSIDKIRDIRELIDRAGKSIYLSVDGGINLETIGDTARAGADVFVAGSAVFGSDDYQTTIGAIRKQLNSV